MAEWLDLTVEKAKALVKDMGGNWLPESKAIHKAIRRLLLAPQPCVTREWVAGMAAKIVNGVQDGMGDAWVINWLEVLLNEGGIEMVRVSGKEE